MKTNIFKLFSTSLVLMFVALFTSCNAFLDQDVPQAILSEEQVSNPQYVDNLVISAYANAAGDAGGVLHLYFMSTRRTPSIGS